MKKKNIKLQLNLQSCILLSEIGKHEDALKYAKSATKECINLILDSITLCYKSLIKIAKNHCINNITSMSE